MWSCFNFFPRWILIRLIWNFSRVAPNSVEILTWIFEKKLFRENFSEILLKTKAIILYRNSWNFALFSEIFFWVRIALKRFAQVVSYIVCPQVRSHVHKQITKRWYGEEKPGRFVFGKLVLFTLGLGLTTPYPLGISVSNFYQTFVTVSIEFWLRFVAEIRPTGIAINFLFITARAERKVRLCVKLFYFFPRWIRIVWPEICRVLPKFSWDSYVEFREKTIPGEFFRNFIENQALPKLVKFRPTFWNFILGPYCIERIRTSSFICCLPLGKEARP